MSGSFKLTDKSWFGVLGFCWFCLVLFFVF